MALRYPLATEKAIGLIEKENKIVFVVDNSSSKPEIKKEVEVRFSVKVKSVNTHITPDGRKKAFVTLEKGFKADDIAARLKIA